ncbi:MAG TPA: histidine kinase [Candidatus Luteococcus avicola]|nr:histidine kinase [Candidatus Luteococcus avicola]
MTSTATRPRAQLLWAETWRLLACWLVGFIIFAIAWSAPLNGTPTPHQDAWMGIDIVAGALLSPLVLLRRRFPLATTIVLTALSIVSAVAVPAQTLATIWLAGRRRLRELLMAGLVWLVGVAVNDRYITPIMGDNATSSGPVVTIAFSMFAFVAVAAIGWSLGARRELHDSWRISAESARREQVARVAQAQTAERARIAREMHDVLAHKISLVSMHAGLLAYQDDLTADERKQTAAVIQTTAQQALSELRHVLGVLREDDHEALQPPQPSLLDLPTLLAQEEAAGAQVTLRVPEGFWAEVAHLAPTTSRHAQRIVQECLTNARKHAPGHPVTVTAGGAPGIALDLCVSNPLATQGSGVPGAQLGLVGLAERAHLAGGTLTAEPEGGRFVVRAHLPWHGSDEQ